MPDDLERSEQQQCLDEIIADYLRDRSSGKSLSPEQLLAQYPDIADSLKEFFDVDQQLRQATAPIRALLNAERQQGDRFVTTSAYSSVATEEGPMLGRFGDYELDEELGRGGMGVVFSARQRSLNRVVALKMIRAEQLASPDDVRRFYIEAEAAASLDHPNIVEVHEFGEYQGRHYYSMKRISGGSLAQLLSGPNADGLPPQKAAHIIALVARAVHHAHQRGILHRDLKPHNVLLDASGAPYVTDFGLARRTTIEDELTPDGHIEGTPCYMAPEVAAGQKELTTAVDVYGLGVILYETLTGHKPFQAATVAETLKQVRTQEPIPPRQRNRRIPRDLEAICLKCLHKAPEKRYASAAAVADDLQRYLDGLPVLARPIRVVERMWKWARRHPARAALTVVTALALVGVLLGALWAWDHERRWRAREWRLLYAAQMNLAWQEWKAGHVERVRELLLGLRPRTGQEDLNDFAWRHLWRRCHHDLCTLRGHTAPVYAVAFSPTQDMLATASADGTVRLWTGTLGKERGILRPDNGVLFAAAFSPDGVTLAVAGEDGAIQLWDVEQRQLRATLRQGNDSVTGLAFSPDGKTLAASSHDGAAILWDISRRAVRNSLREPGALLTCVAFAPDGMAVAAGARDGSVIVWDVRTARVTARPTRHNDWVGSVAFSPDGRLLASGGYDYLVCLWDLRAAKPHGEVRGPERAGISVAFAPDSKVLAIGGRGTVLLWDLVKNRARHVLSGHTGTVNSVGFSRDGRKLASADAYGSVNLWDPATGQAARTGNSEPSQRNLRDLSGQAHAVAFSHSGQLVAAAGRGVANQGEVGVWDAGTGKLVRLLKDLGGPINAIAFGQDDQVLAAAGDDGIVRLWDVDTLRDDRPRLHTLKGHKGAIASLSFSPDGATLASGGLDRTVRLWDVPSGIEQAILREHRGAVTGLAFSPDGQTLASGSYDRTIVLWNVTTQEAEARLIGHLDYVNAVAFAPDGRTLASAGDDLLVKLWDVKARRERRTLKGHIGAVWGLSFTPDGQTLATSGDDPVVKLWDLSIGQARVSLDGHTRLIRGVAFTPDGNTMATAGEDGAVILWRAASVEEVRQAGE